MFQSTRPVRGATDVVKRAIEQLGFNPRAPCGARPADGAQQAQKEEFQSTRPVRGATALMRNVREDARVSIHAPRAGRDRLLDVWRVQGRRFNPRAPCGARRASVAHRGASDRFQSTRPVRGATHGEQQAENVSHVSIHAHMAQISATQK